MKKALKIIIPILLVLLILASIIWYLLVYDPAFTRDFLLQQARRSESKGDHATASWFYNLAYEQSQGNEDVAIELAEQFKSIGNYTKAEFTLSNAIANAPSAKLYAALCKTYVEQDKLLDAVTMLENVTDPAIKAQLDKLRPAAPTVSPEPGFYNQYIQVSMTAEGGTLYINTQGEYPTTESEPYSDPVTMPAGETTVFAIVVGEDGLVSPISIFGYTIGGVVESVSFADPAVESAVRQMLSIPTGTVYTNDLWSITAFEMPEEATVYDDLQYMTYLKELTLRNAAAPLTAISSLTALEKLDISGSRPTQEDMDIVGSLTNLKELNLSDCGLSTIASLEMLTSLVHLDLSSNTVRNIQVLAQMPNLVTLKLPHNALVDLSALSDLANLAYLDVSYNSITTTAPVSSCSALTCLDISHNSLTALEGVEKLVNLADFNAAHNQLTDISVLAGITALRKLNVSGNAITDITCLSGLTGMTDLDFSYNSVTALPSLPEDCALININGSYNQLASIDELKDFWYLNHVYMDYNLLTSIDALAGCPALVQVDVYGNEITDVSALTDHSIVVNYTPI